ncbi:MAG: phosphate/phosphite/phosphonate ABC transporter substrate-binding protein, partial [Verrucomicrobiae bacterium]|nr:phosphate/phosphite/phosphonate ABC transporter substrate-binding protein [Verrucomicrobiae bacterium]
RWGCIPTFQLVSTAAAVAPRSTRAMVPEAAALKKALLGLASDPGAKDMLETMTLKGFGEPDAAAYEAARKLYGL